MRLRQRKRWAVCWQTLFEDVSQQASRTWRKSRAGEKASMEARQADARQQIEEEAKKVLRRKRYRRSVAVSAHDAAASFLPRFLPYTAHGFFVECLFSSFHILIALLPVRQVCLPTPMMLSRVCPEEAMGRLRRRRERCLQACVAYRAFIPPPSMVFTQPAFRLRCTCCCVQRQCAVRRSPGRYGVATDVAGLSCPPRQCPLASPRCQAR